MEVLSMLSYAVNGHSIEFQVPVVAEVIAL